MPPSGKKCELHLYQDLQLSAGHIVGVDQSELNYSRKVYLHFAEFVVNDILILDKPL